MTEDEQLKRALAASVEEASVSDLKERNRLVLNKNKDLNLTYSEKKAKRKEKEKRKRKERKKDQQVPSPKTPHFNFIHRTNAIDINIPGYNIRSLRFKINLNPPPPNKRKRTESRNKPRTRTKTTADEHTTSEVASEVVDNDSQVNFQL
jgi:hypothetical protein